MRRKFSFLDGAALVACGLILLAVFFPWMQTRREATRADQCQDQLRKLGVAFQLHAERDASKKLCSNAYDLMRDGCPDTNSWIGNLLTINSDLKSSLLCTTNELQGIQALNQLLGSDIAARVTLTREGVKLSHITSGFCKDFEIAVDPDQAGPKTPSVTGPVINPGILTNGSEQRLKVVQQAIKDGFNTNYVQSWFLARQDLRYVKGNRDPKELFTRGTVRDQSGGYSGCAVRFIEKAGVATSAVALLGDAQAGDINDSVLSNDLSSTHERLKQGARLTKSFGDGPSFINETKVVAGQAPRISILSAWTTENWLTDGFGTDVGKPGTVLAFPAPISKPHVGSLPEGVYLDDTLPLPDEETFGGVDIVINHKSDGQTNQNIHGEVGGYGGADGVLILQDTRAFAAIHGSGKNKSCNILFADGGVKSLHDKNGDTYLNPGFPVTPTAQPNDTERKLLATITGYENNQCEIAPADFYNGPVLDYSVIKKGVFETDGGSHHYELAAAPAPAMPSAFAPAANKWQGGPQPYITSGDRFSHQKENEFLTVAEAPLSTFSIDVDTASYSKARQFIDEYRQLPPGDAVRVEEFINYFDYDYAPPRDEHPFAVHLLGAECPWEPQHRLVRIALKGKEVSNDSRQPLNLVFLIDVSGSMAAPNKLPLVIRGLHMLADQLRENDTVSIVVYAGAAGLVLPPTSGDQSEVIKSALGRLQAGGSTNGGQGIQLAYSIALQNLKPKSANRVILCSDGDFNVGVTGTSELVNLATEKAKQGVFLTVLGFGIGNLNDAMLSQLSKNANGNYFFVDTIAEARKVLVDQLTGTLTTIAKDVKIQVEFNPAKVASYRLVGYEDRLLAARDFNDDKKDAGEIGAGHTITALYELIPNNGKDGKEVDDLKYQKKSALAEAADSDEWLTVKLRYKPVDSDVSTLLSTTLNSMTARFIDTPQDFQFASGVAMFGMLLKQSPHVAKSNFDSVLEIANAANGKQASEIRQRFVQLVQQAKAIKRSGE